jgi:hypothetical protein
MASNVDEQPPSRPPRPSPEAPRRRPPSRAELKAAQRRAAAPPARRARPPAAPAPRPPVEPDVEPDESPAPPPAQKKLVVLLSVLTAVAVILVGVAIAVTMRGGEDNLPPAAPDNTPVPVTVFRDSEVGISVEYPRAWKRVEVPVAEYRLVVDGGNSVAFTIRVAPIQVPATTANLENFKAFTDGAVRLNTSVNVLKEQAITLNGMLGYYYFYTFADGPVQAVHAHYFLFSGNKMNILVFQSLPDDFEKMAATFDKIAESFRSDPNVATLPPTTAASNTTTTVK